MAQASVGNGRYDDADRAYRKILQLQPDNQDAKDGLHKLDLIRSDNQ
jgi:cytochrome c-type biogenesis protein CcmH/NrfG